VGSPPIYPIAHNLLQQDFASAQANAHWVVNGSSPQFSQRPPFSAAHDVIFSVSYWRNTEAKENPPMMGYVRQANIAHGPQQVNNGTSSDKPYG
jgi:hypothetical protein